MLYNQSKLLAILASLLISLPASTQAMQGTLLTLNRSLSSLVVATAVLRSLHYPFSPFSF